MSAPGEEGGQKFKVNSKRSYQNKSCSECQRDVRKMERQANRQTERQIEDKTTFQLSYQNKSCSECQQDVKKSVRQTGRYAVRQADRVTERQSDRETEWQRDRMSPKNQNLPQRTKWFLEPLGSFGPLNYSIANYCANPNKVTLCSNHAAVVV